MKAMVLDKFGTANAFRWKDWPMPEPAPGEVRIRINAVSVNPVDWKMRCGLLNVPLPTVLGRDLCGEVDALGDGVSEFNLGDDVVGVLIGPRSNGAYAQFATTPTAFVGRKPQGLSDTEAAAIGLAGLTAHRAVTGMATIAPGEAVLVAGASGGVGSFAVPLLRLRGSYTDHCDGWQRGERALFGRKTGCKRKARSSLSRA
jgi:NADPH2:quinone reductase